MSYSRAVGWSVLVKAGAASGRRIDVSGPVVVGRAVEGPGRISGDRKISREHVRLIASDGQVLVEDLGSANGTSVNRVALTAHEPRVLQPGDMIEIGDSLLEVQGTPPAAEDDRAAGAGRAPLAASPEPAGSPPPPVEQPGSPSSIGKAPVIGGNAPPAEVLRGSARVAIPKSGLRIGREPGSDVQIDAPTASRKHAAILVRDGRYCISDLGGGNGTELNGEILRRESRWLNSGDSIEIGGESLRFVLGDRTHVGGGVPTPAHGIRVVNLEGSTLTIGRDSGNDLTLDDPNVSRFHAEVRRFDGGAELRDLGSRNGTRLDHEFIQRAVIKSGSEIGIGPFRLVFDGTRFIRRDDRGALRLRAAEITMQIKGKVILNAASISIEPGEFVVIIGESGSGKTTMVKALAGVTIPTRGRVLVSGESVLTRLTDIGYVPQDEIVHRGLTVIEGLRYAAALRLPKDSTRTDIDGAVHRVLNELGLEEHSHTRIGSLSGGQRKRVGVGTELLNRPSLLFLDEPTTGLDPGLETKLMEVFRSLAQEGTRAVTVVTHATKNLDLPDKVCVMGQGGELCFFGPPADAKDFFGASTYDGIYTALESRPATEWRWEFEADNPEIAATVESKAEPARVSSGQQAPRPRPNVGRQMFLLAQRYLKLLIRDQRNLAILLGQAPLIALGIAFLFQSGVLREDADPNNAALMLFLVVTTMIWLGSIDGAREIIKERPLMERERSVGVTLTAYVSSKAIVLFALVAAQAVLLAAVTFAIRPLYESAPVYLELLAVLTVTGFVSVAVGLLISSLVSSEDQAASFIPLVLIPQLLFGGAIVAVKEMGPAIAGLSNLVYSRWAFAGSGAPLDLTSRINDATAEGLPARYAPGFFDLPVLNAIAILVAFLLVFLTTTYFILKLYRRQG